MIASLEVGAVFRIINEASPALVKILKQIRELNAVVEKAKINLAEIGKMPSMTAAIGETDKLAKTWGDVAANAGAARLATNNAANQTRRAMGNAAGAGGAGGTGGGRHGPRLGGLPLGGLGIPGAGYINAAMAAAGLVGYGAYQAAELEDSVFQLLYHAGMQQNDANRKTFRDILSNSVKSSGYGLHDISEAAKQEIRMFQGTPGGGLDVLPEMLRAATVESRLKGESPEESMRALIGLAHMTKEYSPEAIRKLAPAFAFLSTANPSSLSSIERAAGYAVPLLQSGLEIDPMQSLLMGTALTRAGATNTKSGTWLREMALRAMPGTSMMSKLAFKKHEEALKAFGLVDDHDQPTWFENGKPDLLKMLDIAGGRAAGIPLEKRAAYERALFGAQGGGGFSLLADPKVREQVQALNKEMNSPQFKARYGGFVQAYQDNSTVQNARTAMGEFNMTMADIGSHVLPAVNGALKDFKAVLEGIDKMLPGSERDKTRASTLMLQRAGELAIGGGLVGAPFGLAVPGALGGGVLGGLEGAIEPYVDDFIEEDRKLSPDQQLLHAQALAGGVVQPLTLRIHVDGQLLAETTTNLLLGAIPY
jgi:hypothetical protein